MAVGAVGNQGQLVIGPNLRYKFLIILRNLFEVVVEIFPNSSIINI